MAGVPWYFDEKIRAYKVRPGYKFELLESHASTQSTSKPNPDEVSQL